MDRMRDKINRKGRKTMSYEASAHTIQMEILRKLLFMQNAQFNELLRATELTSDHFNFHLKQLVEAGYIKKQDGRYTLTRDGKEYANRMDTDQKVMEKQPKLSVLLIVENEDGRFLAQQRLKQPFYGFWGRATGKVRWGETLEDAASRELMEETGLRADFRYAGLYHKMDYEKSGDFLEDKYFLVMYGTEPKGEIHDTEGHHNEWLSTDELEAKDKVFESISEITRFAKNNTNDVFEKMYFYEATDY